MVSQQRLSAFPPVRARADRTRGGGENNRHGDESSDHTDGDDLGQSESTSCDEINNHTKHKPNTNSKSDVDDAHLATPPHRSSRGFQTLWRTSLRSLLVARRQPYWTLCYDRWGHFPADRRRNLDKAHKCVPTSTLRQISSDLTAQTESDLPGLCLRSHSSKMASVKVWSRTKIGSLGDRCVCPPVPFRNRWARLCRLRTTGS